MSAPKVKETPRSDSAQPLMFGSGSAHKTSHKRPVSGTSVGRKIRRICSMLFRSGDNPPCMQKILSSTCGINTPVNTPARYLHVRQHAGGGEPEQASRYIHSAAFRYFHTIYTTRFQSWIPRDKTAALHMQMIQDTPILEATWQITPAQLND